MNSLPKVVILTCLACLCLFNTYAQSKITGSIIGKVTSSQSKQALDAAMITVFRLKDSTFHKSAMTDKNGAFEIKPLSVGNYKLYISYFGFKELVKYFSISQEESHPRLDIQLDSI